MAKKEGGSSSATSRSGPERPTITLPPRSSVESLFTGGFSGSGISPGPMTLVSSFFSEGDSYSEFPSFSQLLAGAMASPAAFGGVRPQPQPQAAKEEPGGGSGGDAGLKHNRPAGLAITQQSMFTIPPGLSPASLLDSPGFSALFSPAQGPFGMSHQQALAQVTTQAVQAQVQMHIQPDYSSSSAAPATSYLQLQTITSSATINQQMPPQASDHNIMKESSEVSHSDQRLEPASFPVDRPADDGYNWRKYGQKHVKGSEFPRSYYKCTHPKCPVKKKVERSLEGQITEIIYKSQHNHPPPQNRKGAKDPVNSNGAYALQCGSELSSEGLTTNFNKPKDQESSQATHEHVSGSSESEEVGDAETRADGGDDDERESKRRAIEMQVPDPATSHRTVTEPRIIVQTTSEVDLLDDGYRWRKYGQKVVKGNPYPRSYYKCTNPGCNVRKHIERAANDPKAVITTYEGKHNHDVPAARSSSHNTSNNNAMPQLRPHNVANQQQSAIRTDYSSNEQQVALLRFKEEQIT